VPLYFISGNGDGKVVVERVPSSIPKKRQEVLKWNGWGFKDSGFVAVEKGTDDENPIHAIAFTGSRYELGNGSELPFFYDWVSKNLGIDPSNRKVSNPEPTCFPSPIINEGGPS